MIVMIQGCGGRNSTPEDPWVDEQYVEFEDESDIATQKNAPKSAKDSQSTDQRLKAPQPDIYRIQNKVNDWRFFTQAYPPNPVTPPGIEDRQRVFDPKRDSEIRYGLEEYLPTVPKSATKPFPRDYVGVERWNRQNSLPGEGENSRFTRIDSNKPTPVKDEFDEDQVAKKSSTSKSAVKRSDGTDEPLNPSDDEFRFDPSEGDSISDQILTEDPKIQKFEIGPQASFALNFLEDLRGASFTAGANFLYTRNRFLVLDGWFGYRQIVTGIGGENKEVFTLQNIATGILVGPMFYRSGPRHFRWGIGAEFDYNFYTTHTLAGGGRETYSNIHTIAISTGFTWHEEGWALFSKYNMNFRKISEDRPGILHVIEVGVTVYVL